MSNIIIFHGTDCSPDNEFYWYAWLKNELEKDGLRVEVPHYPEINHEDIATFLPKVLKNHNYGQDTTLVGHSAGAPLILSILENIEAKVKATVLVAGYSTRLSRQDKDPVLQESYNWQKIKKHSGNFTFINSVADPWGCDDKQGRLLFDRLGGTQIIKNDGHFGSERQNMPYVEFPLLLNIITESAK